MTKITQNDDKMIITKLSKTKSQEKKLIKFLKYLHGRFIFDFNVIILLIIFEIESNLVFLIQDEISEDFPTQLFCVEKEIENDEARSCHEKC